MSTNIDTSTNGTVNGAPAPAGGTPHERVPLRKKTDKSIRSASKSIKVVLEALNIEVEMPEDELGIFATKGSPALEGDLAAEAESAVNTLVSAMNGLVRIVKKVPETFITEASVGGGGTQLAAGHIVVGAKMASDQVKAMLAGGVKVERVNEALGLVKLEGIEDSLPRLFVARKDLAGRNAKS